MSGSELLDKLGCWYAPHRRISALSFLAALGLSLVAVICLQPATLFHQNYIAAEPVSERAFVAAEIVNEYASVTPDLLILGGSSLREGLPDRAALAAHVTQQCGRDLRVLLAATAAQHPADGEAVLAALPGVPNATIIGISERRLFTSARFDPLDPRGQTIELPRAARTQFGALANHDARSSAIDSFDQMARLKTSLAATFRPRGSGHASMPALKTEPLPLQTTAEKRQSGEIMVLSALRADPTGASGEPNTAYWLNLADRLRAEGGRVLFVILPMSAEAAPYLALRAKKTDGAMASIGARYPLIDLRAADGLEAANFADLQHLSALGRQSLWPILGQAITRLACPD